MTKKCPICESEYRFHTQENDRNILICENCRHMFFEDVPNLEKIVNHYTQTYKDNVSQFQIQQDNREYYKSHYEELLDLFPGRRSISIMDYGCSYPVFIEEAIKGGCEYAVGVDYDEYVLNAGQNLSENGCVISPEQLSELDQKFDVIRLSHSLEHTICPITTMKELKGLLKKGGIFYLTHPSFPVFKLGDFDAPINDAVYPEHLHFFTPLSMLALAKRLGLRIKLMITHQKEEEKFLKFGAYIDYPYATKKLAALQDKIWDGFDMRGLYPHYAGDNMTTILQR